MVQLSQYLESSIFESKESEKRSSILSYGLEIDIGRLGRKYRIWAALG